MLRRESYIPKGHSLRVRSKTTPAIAYLYERAGGIYAAGFGGKRAKPDFHFRFRTEDQRSAKVEEYIANQEAWATAKTERQAKATAFEHTLKVGDILYSSWGYDQTNIDFYLVTKVVGKKSVKIREVCGSIDHHDGCQSNMVVASESFKEDSKEMLKRVGEGNCVSIASYANASPWSGEPLRETDAYSGH